MSDQFQQPGRGDKFEPSEYAGALLLVYPTEYFSAIPTQHGDTAVVDCHIVVLDRVDPQTGAPMILRDARIFGRAMVPQLKGGVGGRAILGRLGQGQNTKGNPPWVLTDFSAGDAEIARQYTNQFPDPRKAATFQNAPSSVGPAGEYRTEPRQAPPTSPVSAPSGTPGWGSGNNPQIPAQPSGPPSWAASPSQPAPQQWGGAPAAPTPAPAATPNGATNGHDPQLVAFLASKGVNVALLPPDADLKMIASTFQ